MTNHPIRFSISRENAARSRTRLFGEAFYEPTDAELAALTRDERAVLSVFEGDQQKGTRLTIFAMPPWDGIIARLRGAEIPEASRALGELEIRNWISNEKPVLALSGARTGEVARIATAFDSMQRDFHPAAPIANAFVRRLAHIVETVDLQLAHELPEPLVVDRSVFDTEFSTQPRAEVRPLQRVMRERIVARCAELTAWLPKSTMLEVGDVSRITTNDEKSTGVCVLVAHPGSLIRQVVVFPAEEEAS